MMVVLSLQNTIIYIYIYIKMHAYYSEYVIN